MIASTALPRSCLSNLVVANYDGVMASVDKEGTADVVLLNLYKVFGIAGEI